MHAILKKIKDLYYKYYYISPLDQADSAESNRLFNFYWTLFWSIMIFLFSGYVVFKYRNDLSEYRIEVVCFGIVQLFFFISFILSKRVKNVAREKAYILKNLPIYIVVACIYFGATVVF